MFSMPISIRYGLCKFAAIANGKPQLDSVSKTSENTKTNYNFELN